MKLMSAFALNVFVSNDWNVGFAANAETHANTSAKQRERVFILVPSLIG